MFSKGFFLRVLNSLPNDKILALTEFKAFADNRNNRNSLIVICVGKSRKHCRKRNECWLPAFSPFHTMFSKASIAKGVKIWDCVVMG